MGAIEMAKPSIAILGINYSPEPTGIAPYTSGLASGLVAKGYQVRVLTGYPHYPSWRVLPGYPGTSMAENIGGVDVMRYRHYVPSRTSSIGRILMEASFAARLLPARLERPDVIVSVSPALLATAAALARARSTRGRPAIGVWVQDLYGLGVVETGAMGGRAAAATSALESRVLRKADGVAVIHERFRNHVVNKLGVSPSRATVIRNWSHVAMDPLDDKSSVREALGWKSNETVVLHAGNMGAKQGLENVVGAARLAESRGLPVKFVLLGDGNQRANLERQSAGLSNINFVDPLPDSHFFAALQAADVLLVNERASLSEMAVPSKLTSYFASGRPVLAATDARSVTAGEIESSEAGLLVEPENPQSLLSGVIKLAENPDLAARLGVSGQKFRADNLTMNKAVDDFEDWILRLNRGRKSR